MRRDLVCAALGLALVVVYWIAANGLQQSFLSDAVGADGLPKAYAVLLAVLSVLIAAHALWRKPANQADEQSHARALGVAGLGFAYAALAAFIGYAICVMLLAGAAAWYYGARRPVPTALFALGTAALLWVMFAQLLGVAMP